MQWSLDGEVTWRAPRHFALAFIPGLGICTLVLYVFLSFTYKPRPGDEHLVFPVLILLGSMFVAIQLLHLYLIEKAMRRNGS